MRGLKGLVCGLWRLKYNLAITLNAFQILLVGLQIGGYLISLESGVVVLHRGQFSGAVQVEPDGLAVNRFVQRKVETLILHFAICY